MCTRVQADVGLLACGVRNGEFEHAALAEVYDVECMWDVADDDVLAFVDRQSGVRVADVGCGTGRLTVALAAAGHSVTGVDPAAASLARARNRPDGECVTWMSGTATALPPSSFDVVVMTAHVAQFLVTNEEWRENFAAVNVALVPGGRLFFDSRDPAAAAWKAWNPADSRRVLDVGGRRCVVWTETGAPRRPDLTVDFIRHYEFSDGERLTSESSLRFRTEAEIRDSLNELGFGIDVVRRSWAGSEADAGELLVEAYRRF